MERVVLELGSSRFKGRLALFVAVQQEGQARTDWTSVALRLLIRVSLLRFDDFPNQGRKRGKGASAALRSTGSNIE